jgi:hypothetical protein
MPPLAASNPVSSQCPTSMDLHVFTLNNPERQDSAMTMILSSAEKVIGVAFFGLV